MNTPTQTDYNKLFNDRFNAALRELTYPIKSIYPAFGLWLKLALLHHNMFTLQTDWETLKAIRNKMPEDLDMLEFCNALNAIEMSLPVHYGKDHIYDDAQEATKEMTAIWNEITTPIKERIQNELQAEYEAEQRKIATQQALSGGTHPKRKAIKLS